mgnify:CR=1 FL=1
MGPDRPRFETSRLIVAMPEVAQATDVAEYYAANREFLAPWEPVRREEYFTEPYWRERLVTQLADYDADRAASFVVWRRDDPDRGLLGTINLSSIVRGPLQAANLGYSLAQAAQGHGFMTESLEPIIAWAFDTLRLHRLHAGYLPRNERSAAVLRRLGFQVEGYHRDYLFIAGRWEDHIQTGLVDPGQRPPG